METHCIALQHKIRRKPWLLFRRDIILVILVIVFSSCREEYIVDINNVINKSNDEVVQILGKPDTAYWQPIFNKKIFTTVYTKYKIEFRFSDGTATDIIVRQPQDLAFSPATLKRFGLAETQPDKIEKNVLMRWNDPAENIEMVSFYTKKRDLNGLPEVYEFYFKGRKVKKR